VEASRVLEPFSDPRDAYQLGIIVEEWARTGFDPSSSAR
jgi:hypothetical protein